MLARLTRLKLILGLLLAVSAGACITARAQDDHGHDHGTPAAAAHGNSHSGDSHGAEGGHGAEGDHGADAHHGAGHHPVFGNEQGTWFHGIASALFGQQPPHREPGAVPKFSNVNRDFVVVTALVYLALAVVFVRAAKKVKLRPEGKPASVANIADAALDGFRDYLVGIMGESLARKYTSLIASFFFTIVTCNWLGLVPGMLAPTSIPAVPISFALLAFFSVHVIAIKEVGVKSWFMHFVGEPVWLAPLNFPMHFVGELIKPISLSLRLLCNVFGEEQVIVQLTVLSLGIMAAINLPIPVQLPMLLLGTFFGALQALVFSTLLAIYISILSTHHDDHDEHNQHGHVEHDVVKGNHVIVAHPSQTSVA